MRRAIQFGFLFAALFALPHALVAESTKEEWRAALERVESLIRERTNDVRKLRKKTDELAENFKELAQSKVFKLTPEVKQKLILQRVNYYTQLGAYNADIREMEKKLPTQVAPDARQKVLDALSSLRNEVRATVVALNRLGRSIREM